MGILEGFLWGWVSSRGLARGRGDSAGREGTGSGTPGGPSAMAGGSVVSPNSSSPGAQSVSDSGPPRVSRVSQEAGKQQLSSEELERARRPPASPISGAAGSGGPFPLPFPLRRPSCLAKTLREEEEELEEQ